MRSENVISIAVREYFQRKGKFLNNLISPGYRAHWRIHIYRVLDASGVPLLNKSEREGERGNKHSLLIYLPELD